MPLRAIDRVEIFADGTLLATITANGTPNFSANYSWAGAAVGTHVLKATAYAKDGTKVDTAEVSFAVVGAIKVRLDSPHPLMTILSSDTFHLTARASQEAGRIAAVQFYTGDTLLKTVQTEPFAFAWQNPPVGIHHLRARAIDAMGQYADTPFTAVRAIEQPVIELDPGIAGAEIEDEHLAVRGKIVAPSNSALTINGLVATITDWDRFFVNDVPLQHGANAVTIELRSEAAQKDSQSFQVTSLQPAPFLVTVDRSEGLAPLSTNLVITSLSSVPFQKIEIDYDGDGHVDKTLEALENGQATIPIEYSDPGIYKIKVSVIGAGAAVIYCAEREVVAANPVIFALRGMAIYETLLGRLRDGKVDSAADTLGVAIRDAYRTAFSRFGDKLAGLAKNLGTVTAVDVTDDYTILRVHRRNSRGFFEYEVLLMQDEDGVRRIVGF